MNAVHTVAYPPSENIDHCVYCGMPADSIDHIPPRYMRQHLREVELSAREIEVKSCRECNSGLGCKALLTITERRQYIKQWLRKRYAQELNMPAWTSAELDELQPDLRGFINRSLAVKKLIRERLSWPQGRADETSSRPILAIKKRITVTRKVVATHKSCRKCGLLWIPGVVKGCPRCMYNNGEWRPNPKKYLLQRKAI